MSDSGSQPGMDYLVMLRDAIFGTEGAFPDIIWDGLLPMSELFFGQPEKEKIIIEEASDTNFLDLDVFWYVAFPFFHSPSRDKSEFKGLITNLPPISKWN